MNNEHSELMSSLVLQLGDDAMTRLLCDYGKSICFGLLT